MTDNSQLQLKPKDGDSLLRISKKRSDIIARGLRDAGVLVRPLPDPLSEIRRLAEEGDWNAQLELGEAFYNGYVSGPTDRTVKPWRSVRIGVPQNYAEAINWYRKAADQGLPYAALNLGEMHEKGDGVPVDLVEARRWYWLAVDTAMQEPDGWDPDWLRWALEKAAESGGSAVAQFRIARYHGSGTLAANWYRKAADQGHAAAQSALGILYFTGNTVPEDHAQGVKWCRKAAEQGDAAGQRALGLAYLTGKGVPEDYAQGMNWCRKAAEQGDASAQAMLAVPQLVRLGYVYREGQGVPQDYAEAARWFGKAAELGDLSGQHFLGLMYACGLGMSQDLMEAHKWLSLSAEHSLGHDQVLRAADRDYVTKQLTPQQLAEAQRIARTERVPFAQSGPALTGKDVAKNLVGR